MGGNGSGRHGGKYTIGRTRSCELSTAALKEYLRAGYSGFRMAYRCNYDDVVVEGVVDTVGSAPNMFVRHNTRCKPPVTIFYTISLDRTFPYGGGVRWWFLCPQTGRRAAKLYLPLGGRKFLCRQAYGLVHDTAQMSTVHRLSRRLTRLSSKLGDPNHRFLEPPKKPSRMRWHTYDCLVDQWYRARTAYWKALQH